MPTISLGNGGSLRDPPVPFARMRGHKERVGQGAIKKTQKFLKKILDNFGEAVIIS